MSLNAKKLERLITHLDEDGALDPATLAGLLRINNTLAIREYVAEVASRDGDPSLLDRYDDLASIPKEEEEEAAEEPAPEPAPAKKTAPAKKAVRKKAAKAPSAPQGDDPLSEVEVYQLRGSDGLLRELEVLTLKKGRLILQEKVEKDIVMILLGGEPAHVDLNALGETYTLNGNIYPAAAIRTAAELAR